MQCKIGEAGVPTLARFVNTEEIECPISASRRAAANAQLLVSNDNGERWAGGMSLNAGGFHYYGGLSRPSDGATYSTQGTLRIGLLLPASEPIALNVTNAFHLAIANINQEKTLFPDAFLLGVVADTRGSPEEAARIAGALARSSSMIGLVGAYHSSSTVPVSQNVSSSEYLPLISPFSTSDVLAAPVDHPYFLRIIYSNRNKAQMWAQLFMSNDFEFNRIAIIHDQHAYPTNLGEALQREFEKLGGIVLNRTVLLDTVRSSAVVPPARAPDVVYQRALAIVQQLKASGARVFHFETSYYSGIASIYKAFQTAGVAGPGYAIFADSMVSDDPARAGHC